MRLDSLENICIHQRLAFVNYLNLFCAITVVNITCICIFAARSGVIGWLVKIGTTSRNVYAKAMVG